jgi:hypothetical protein
MRLYYQVRMRCFTYRLHKQTGIPHCVGSRIQAEDAYSSMAPDPTFAFVGGP